MVPLLEDISEEIESSYRLNSELVHNMTETVKIEITLLFVIVYLWVSPTPG